jgi:type IV secretory pathway VirB3-like protein
MDQLRQVFRRLSRAPLFTGVTLITLGVGVGATALIFSVVEGVLLKPLPYPHSGQLISVAHTAPGIGIKELNMAPSIYFIDREQSTTLQDIGAYDSDSLSVTGVGEPEHVAGLNVTDGTLRILGVAPALGRLFTREDDSPGSPATVLLSYEYWRRRFDAAPSVIGRSITVDGKSRQIIGVLPQGFQFLDDQDDPALFLPFQWDRAKTRLGNFSQNALASLKPGVTIEQAKTDMARLLPVAMRSFPPPEGFSAKMFESAHIAPDVKPL